MPTYGRIDEFSPDGEESWQEYSERLDHFFAANEIADEKKQAIFLSACGARTYKLMCNLLTPTKPAEKTFPELIALVKEHYNPAPSEIAQRFRFNMRVQKSEESISDFVNELRALSTQCNYGDQLNSMLRDRLVCGIKDKDIQRRLLSETGLTYDTAHKMACGLEAATKHAENLHGESSLSSVHKINTSSSNHNKLCWRCGSRYHSQEECQFKEQECFNCGKIGHTKRRCRMKKQSQSFRSRDGGHGGEYSKAKHSQMSRKAHYLETTEEIPDDSNEYVCFYNIASSGKAPVIVNLKVNDQPIQMELDTGAGKSLLNQITFDKLAKVSSNIVLNSTATTLRTYTGENIKVDGEVQLTVSYENQKKSLSALVVHGNSGPNILGRDWLHHLRLDWTNIFQFKTGGDNVRLNAVLKEFETVFDGKLGKMEGVTAKIHVDPEAIPKYFKPRPVPYALQEGVEKELEKSVAEGTLMPVQFSEWAAPIVPVVKEDKSVRICGDYKVTVNQVSKLDNYPIPKLEDLLATLTGGQRFTKLDLTRAYNQLELEPESRKYLTINTHKGLFQPTRLVYGVSSAPGIYQRAMEDLLRGIPFVIVRVDDILISGLNDADHITNISEVLRRISRAGLKLQKNKCIFMAEEVVYCGQKINKYGIQPMKEKVEAIQQAQAPKNISMLRSYLGMINYYRSYLPQLASTLQPLYKLLQKDTSWVWGPEQEKCFTKSKMMLNSSTLLVHFDSKKELILACDASPYGIGSVLSHRMQDGSERPIAFASQTLNDAEKNYAQIDKEALAIIFGVKKFHQYVYGRAVTILTDHKPLLGLLGPDKAIPKMVSPRMLRWILTLSGYEYNLLHRPGNLMAHADAMSRLPLLNSPLSIPEMGESIMLVDVLNKSALTSEDVRRWTRRDPILSKVLDWCLSGWPLELVDENEAVRPYFSRKLELSIEDGCVLWGNRVVVPKPGREILLDELHASHPGICKMKALARCYIWWPGMDKDLETKVRSCEHCQLQSKDPPVAPLHPWEYPSGAWQRIHIDYAGPLYGKYFLIAVDAFSKWIEVEVVNSPTSQVTIEKLRRMFATQGLPNIVVSDNGTCFTSSEFKEFMFLNGITHVTSAPWHPSSNGQAERAVQTFKNSLKGQANGSLETRVSRFLFYQHSTPHTTTGHTPAELLCKRRFRTRLSLIKPNLAKVVQNKQKYQKNYHDLHAKERSWEVGDTVLTKNYRKTNDKWSPGKITQQTGPISFKVALADGSGDVRRHQDQIVSQVPPEIAPTQVFNERNTLENSPGTVDGTDGVSNMGGDPGISTPVLRRSQRIIKPPCRYED